MFHFLEANTHNTHDFLIDEENLQEISRKIMLVSYLKKFNLTRKFASLQSEIRNFRL